MNQCHFHLLNAGNSRETRTLELGEQSIEYVNRTGNITSQFQQIDNRYEAKKRNKLIENNKKRTKILE
jgi:hypothetical protein